MYANAFYDANYSHFTAQLLAEIREEAFGADIGQTSWLTVSEYDRFLEQLDPSPKTHVLDICCGSGGPALYAMRKTRCLITGLDSNPHAIATAQAQAIAEGMAPMAHFVTADAAGSLPFPDQSFDRLLCIDGIHHLPSRFAVLHDWARVLRPGALALFTDPVVITGPVSKEEIAVRGSVGHFVFVPAGYTETLLADAGFQLTARQDVTENVVFTASRWRTARERRREKLHALEGSATFYHQQQFLEATATLARERRLSRFVYTVRVR